MKIKYIYESKLWPHFNWDKDLIAEKLILVRHQQGRLAGQMESLGFDLKAEAALRSMTEEVVKTSEIEGEKLDQKLVRSSIAKRLGIDIGGLTRVDRNTEGIVEMILDATQNYDKALTLERLFSWHAALFPTGRSGLTKIKVGQWRDDSDGPMQVISGPMRKNKVHFQAIDAHKIKNEMKVFLAWFNTNEKLDAVLKAAIAHLWLITIHPFEDGNGRIARAVADMALARSEKSPQRFYSMSAQINIERKSYYKILESTQKGDLDITQWLDWFLDCLEQAFEGAESILTHVFNKTQFWKMYESEYFNERQKKVMNRLLDGFSGNLNSSKWAAIAKCSQDTAARDITDLVKRSILLKNPAGGRSTSYRLSPY